MKIVIEAFAFGFAGGLAVVGADFAIFRFCSWRRERWYRRNGFPRAYIDGPHHRRKR